MQKFLLFWLICILALPMLSDAQLTENFNDGDFTNNPTWSGNAADWVVNPSFQLQSNDTVLNSTYYLSTGNTLATGVQWDMYFKLDFSTSSNNYVDAYLIAGSSDLTSTGNTGYFVRMGGTKDEISLYRRDAGTDVLLIDGVDGSINLSSNNNIKLRVIRNATNQWSLYRDMTGVGTNYFLEGVSSDATYTTSTFFGFLVKQSTASFFQKHFIDDITIQPFVPDVTPPVVQSATVVGVKGLDVLFDEPVDATTANVVANYSVNVTGNPVSAIRDATNSALVHLTFATIFPNGTNTVTVNSVTDISGNAIVNGTGTFSYVADLTPPSIVSVTTISATIADVLFSEQVEVTSAEQVSNYTANNGIGNPVIAVRDAANFSLVRLTFGTTFPNGPLNTLTVNNVKDPSDNAIVNGTGTFTYVADVTPPVLVSAIAISSTAADALLNESIDITTAQLVTNYSVSNGIGNPISATLDGTNNALVHLLFGTSFTGGVVNTLTASNINDLAGNTLVNATANFMYTPPYVAQRFDVILDEIFADPTPIIGLPDAEYVEIRNRTGSNINLQGWRITSSSTSSGAFPSYDLPAGGYLILTSTSNVAALSSFGTALGITSFPALLNDGTTLSLISKEGLAVHAVSYNTTWYRNLVKSDGGWSLEMIDIQNPCTGADNWKASENSRGGTPGTINSVNGNNPDQAPPQLIRAAVIDSVSLILTFNEALDSTSAASVTNYTFSNGAVVSATILAPAFNKVNLILATPMLPQTVYTITVNNVKDCSGNIINARNTAKVGLPSSIDSFDIVINEILFNPKSNGVDYVEIYNRSEKIFDLKKLYIANRDLNSGSIRTLSQLTTESQLIFPQEYYVISENGPVVKQNYFAKNPDNFLDVTMPSYSDDEGIAAIMNSLGKVVDELHYDAKWHFALIDNEEGVSLERIDYNKPTQDKSNWFSAASTVGYGTPSYQNSQFRMDLTVNGSVTITPKIFSPDNDGFEDFTVINYQVDETGYVGNITIFDASGRPVKVLVKNATLAQVGSFRWDGLNDKFFKVPTGTYIIYTEIFKLDGKKKSFKNTVTVASRF